MANRQLVNPNLDPYIYQGGKILLSWLGYCLAYAQVSFNAPWAGSSAKESMDKSNLHRDRSLPSGVYVFIWFDHWGTYSGIYKNWGHVAIYKDGTIWSSPISNKPTADTWGSIGAVEANYRATYTGWSYDISGFPVAEYVPDVVPAPSTQGYQRKVGSVKVAYRKEPKRSGAFIDWLDAGATVDFKGYVLGELVDGNSVWFVGKYTSGFTWSGAYDDASTHDLPNLGTAPDTPTVPTNPVPPVVVPDKPYIFGKAFEFVTEVIPAAQGNFAYLEFPTSPGGIVLHDFGTAGVNSYESVINTFKKKDSFVSAHFVVSKDKVTQMVALEDRAYHAKTGNSNYGIEVDPAFKNDPIQIENVRKLVQGLQELDKKKLTLHKHPEFVATSCGDDIVLAAYEVPYPVIVASPDTSKDDEQDVKINGIMELLKAIGKLFTDFIARFK